MNAVVTTTAAAPAAPAASTVPSAHATTPIVMTALAGTFIANLGGQFAGTNLADIQGSLGVSADEASWITTVYTAANFFGFVLAPVLARAFGLRRFFLASAVVFAAYAWLSALTSSLPVLLVLRAIGGLAGGMFGPIAFVAVFRLWSGPRLKFGLALLAFVLLVSVYTGPALSGPIEAAFGWRALFLAQSLAGLAMIVAGARWMPKGPLNLAELKTDWVSALLLAVAMSSLVVFVAQGTRRFWFESPLIAVAASVSVGAWIGFALMYVLSPVRIIDLRTLLVRRFGVPITLNLVFRATFAVTVYLVPLLLGFTQGYRPLQTSYALWWVLLPQVATFPLVWRLMHCVDGRVPMLLGLLAVGLGVWLASVATNQTSAPELHASLVLVGVGQMLFLVPTLLIGAGSLRAEDGPTATVAFNATTVGGTALGVGLVTDFVTEREKFHSNVLVDHVSSLNPLQADRLAALADQWATRASDDTLATARAVAQVAAAVRREAWLLAINDAFVLIALVLLLATLGIALVGRSPPLVRNPPGDLP
jgi:DHA2 family multidrug resistance protein